MHAISALWDSDIASISSVLAFDTAATRAFFHFSLDFPLSYFDRLVPPSFLALVVLFHSDNSAFCSFDSLLNFWGSYQRNSTPDLPIATPPGGFSPVVADTFTPKPLAFTFLAMTGSNWRRNATELSKLKRFPVSSCSIAAIPANIFGFSVFNESKR